MTELKQKPGETAAEFAERQARQDAEDKKFAARDPNLPVALHDRFEAIEARLKALEEELAAKLAKTIEPKGPEKPANS